MIRSKRVTCDLAVLGAPNHVTKVSPLFQQLGNMDDGDVYNLVKMRVVCFLKFNYSIGVRPYLLFWKARNCNPYPMIPSVLELAALKLVQNGKSSQRLKF